MGKKRGASPRKSKAQEAPAKSDDQQQHQSEADEDLASPSETRRSGVSGRSRGDSLSARSSRAELNSASQQPPAEEGVAAANDKSELKQHQGNDGDDDCPIASDAVETSSRSAAAWTLDDVLTAAAVVLGIPSPEAAVDDGALASSAVECTTAPPLCFSGVHPLGLGNFTACFGDEEPQSLPAYDDAAHVVVLKCGHMACASCFASAISSTTSIDEMDGGSRLALTARCAQCDQPMTLTVDATEWAGGRDAAALKAVKENVPRLANDTNTAANAAAGMSVARFTSNMLRQLDATAEGRASGKVSQAEVKASQAGAGLCGICEEEPEVARCNECGFGLCTDCLATVHSKGRFKRHTVEEVQPTETSVARAALARRQNRDGASDAAPPRPMCTEHPDYPLELFCQDCSGCVCLRCHFSGSHKGHRVVQLADLHAAISKDVTSNANHMSTAAQSLADVVTVLASARTDVDAAFAQGKDAVARAFALAREAIDKSEAASLDRLTSWHKLRSETLSSDLRDVQRTRIALASAGIGLRSKLRDTSIHAITVMLDQREVIGRRSRQLAASSTVAKMAVTDAMQGGSSGHTAGLSDRVTTLLGSHGPQALRLFAEPLVGAAPAGGEDAPASLTHVSDAIEVALARLESRCRDGGPVHWNAEPQQGLTDALSGRSNSRTRTDDAPAASTKVEGKTRSRAGKRVSIADPQAPSPGIRANSAGRGSAKAADVTSLVTIGSLLDKLPGGAADATEQHDGRRAVEGPAAGHGGRAAARHAEDHYHAAHHDELPLLADEEDDDRDAADDRDGSMPPPLQRGSAKPRRPVATDDAPEFNFTTQDARGGVNADATKRKLELLASQWDAQPAPQKAHRAEDGPGAAGATGEQAAPVTSALSRVRQRGFAAAKTNASSRPGNGNGGGGGNFVLRV